MIAQRSISLFLLVAVLGTAGPAFAQHDIGDQFDLGVGQSATVGSAGLRVGFDQIVSESRCPIGVTCIWQGAATGRLWAESPSNPRKPFDLSTSKPFQTQAAFAGYIIKMIAVRPYPHYEEVIDPSTYVVTVLVTAADGPTVPTEPTTWSAIKALYR